MSVSAHNVIRTIALPVSLLSLLIFANGCGAVPDSTAATAPSQAPEAAAAQNAPPTPPLATTQLPAAAQEAPAAPTPSKPHDCPKLESSIYQLIQAPEPLRQAQQVGLRLKGDKLQVVLIVSREDVQFAPAFGVEVGSRSGTQIQAFVPLGQLCALAQTDEVVAIRLPAQAIPQ